MNADSKFHIVSLILVGLSILLASCSYATVPSMTNLYTERVSGLGYLLLRIRVDHSEKPCLKSGDSLNISFTVTNEGQKPVVHESKDKPVLNLTIVESPSMEIVSSWADQNPDKLQHRVEWQPGESKTLNLKWQIPQKEYAHQELIITGLVSETNPEHGQFAIVEMCLGSPLHQFDLPYITPSPR
ncbi:MAG: hypothetical protein HZB51_23725 [Chloroflexi bacterium]|nr:hypothetical protein [Chloroflexota bacterium]